MAINQQTGQWEEEDASVENKLTGLLKEDSPLMMKATGDAMMGSAHRGLQNSSIAAQAGQAAVIGAALPIAQQDATQINQRNVTQQTGGIQKDITGMQNRSSELIAQNKEVGDTNRLAMQLGSTERLAFAQMANQKEMQGAQLTSEEKRAADDLKAAQARQDSTNATQLTIAANQNASQEKIVGMQTASQQTIADLNRVQELAIAKMNLGASDRNNLTSAVNTANTNYVTYVSNIMSNPNIPEGARTTYINMAAGLRDDSIRLAMSTYGNTTLTWSTPTATPSPTPTPTPNDTMNNV